MAVTPVALSVAEVSHAALVGVRRRVRSLGWASTDYVGAGLDPWGRDIEAACAEMAVAKALGVYYDLSEGRFCGAGDDVHGWQVRSTERPDGCLLLRPRDAVDARYVLAVGLAPRFTVAGWAWGHEVKVDQYRRDPGERGLPCWMFPQEELRPC
jgi:hypothetical protein